MPNTTAMKARCSSNIPLRQQPSFTPRGRKGDWIQPDLEQHPKGHLHHKIFIDDILNNTCESATPEDAVATVKIINAAYEAAQTGKTITLC